MPFELLEESTEETSYDLYRIVLPFPCSSELFSAAQEFKDRLSEKTGVPCEIVSDKEQILQTENIFEIFLGNTSRPLSQSAMKDLRTKDYLCQEQDGILLLGGRSDVATKAALDYFYETYFEHATASGIIPSETNILYRAAYSIPPLSIDGFDLASFEIVYEKNADEPIVTLAKNLQALLAKDAFYSLNLQAQSNQEPTKKRISLMLSADEPAGISHIRFDEYGVVITANTPFGLSVAVKEFLTELLASATSSAPFGTRGTVKSVNYTQNRLTLASALLPLEPSTGTEARDQIINFIYFAKEVLPDAVFVKHISETFQSQLLHYLSDLYVSDTDAVFWKNDASCRLCQTLSPTATLYQSGNDSDGFLLLIATEPPTEELLASLENKNLPLLVILQTSDSSEPWKTDSFDQVMVTSANHASFELWAEPNCLLISNAVSDSGCPFFVVERTSIFYSSNN